MKKNIMVLVTKLANGGAEKSAMILAENLSKKYNVYLTVFDNSFQDYKTDVKIIDLKTNITNNPLKKTINFFKRICRVKKIKKQYKIDCAISFLTGPNFVNILSKKNNKAIISIRNNIKEKNYLVNIINKFIIKKADKIVVVSEDMRKYYIQHDKVKPNRITTIYNTCNLKRVNEALKSKEIVQYKEIFSNGKLIISLGRYIKQKGQWHLIRAFSEIAKKYNNYKLVIFGRGDKKIYLQKLINELHLQNKVYLLDFVDNPYYYLKQSHIFVLPSLFEGCSNAILEAMACGLPVIATDCDYGNKIILAPNNKEKVMKFTKEEFGILVPVGDKKYYNAKAPLTHDEKELYNALKALIKDDELQNFYHKKSLERIQDFQDNIGEWINCIEEE